MDGKARILLVEDEDAIRKISARYLQKVMGDNAEIQCASSAEEALEHLSRQEFDLVVTDNNMSGLTGLQLIAQCQEDHPDLKIILMSGRLTQLINDNQIPEGVRTIAKPFTLEELHALIKEALT